MELTNRDLIKLKRYLNNEMNQNEIIEMDQLIESNIAYEEFVALYYLTDKSKFKFDEETIKFGGKIKSLHTKKPKLAIKRKLYYLTAIIAAAVLLLFLVVNNFNQSTTEVFYADNSNWDSLPTFITKNNNQEEKLVQIQQSFEQGDFFTTKKVSEEFLLKNKYNSDVLLYLAISSIEMNELDAAKTTLETLLHSDLIDFHKAYWYLALVNAKEGNKEEVKANLKEIVKNKSFYHYKKAKKWLKKLK